VGRVQVEQSCRLIYKGEEYQITFRNDRNPASIRLPDGQFFELPKQILFELSDLCTGKSPKSRSTSKLRPRTGEKWSSNEDEKLARSFFNGVDFKLIASDHQRSRGAIISRLQKLGHMTP